MKFRENNELMLRSLAVNAHLRGLRMWPKAIPTSEHLKTWVEKCCSQVCRNGGNATRAKRWRCPLQTIGNSTTKAVDSFILTSTKCPIGVLIVTPLKQPWSYCVCWVNSFLTIIRFGVICLLLWLLSLNILHTRPLTSLPKVGLYKMHWNTHASQRSEIEMNQYRCHVYGRQFLSPLLWTDYE